MLKTYDDSSQSGSTFGPRFSGKTVRRGGMKHSRIILEKHVIVPSKLNTFRYKFVCSATSAIPAGSTVQISTAPSANKLYRMTLAGLRPSAGCCCYVCTDGNSTVVQDTPVGRFEALSGSTPRLRRPLTVKVKRGDLAVRYGVGSSNDSGLRRFKVTCGIGKRIKRPAQGTASGFGSKAGSAFRVAVRNLSTRAACRVCTCTVGAGSRKGDDIVCRTADSRRTTQLAARRVDRMKTG